MNKKGKDQGMGDGELNPEKSHYLNVPETNLCSSVVALSREYAII